MGLVSTIAALASEILTSVTTQIKTYFTGAGRFTPEFLIPALAFILGLLGILMGIVGVDAPRLWWEQLPSDGKLLTLALFAVLVIIINELGRGLTGFVRQLYSGNWPQWTWLQKQLREPYIRNMGKFKIDEASLTTAFTYLHEASEQLSPDQVETRLYPVLREPLSAYKLIEAKNLALVQMPPQLNVVSSVRDLVGHYTLIGLAAGKPIATNTINPLANKKYVDAPRTFMTVNASTAVPGEAGSETSLYLTSKEGRNRPIEYKDLMLVQRISDTQVVLSIPVDQAVALARQLPTHQAMLTVMPLTPQIPPVTLVVHCKARPSLQRGNVLQASDLSWIEGEPPANTIQDPQDVVDKIYWPVTDTSGATPPDALMSDAALPVGAFNLSADLIAYQQEQSKQIQYREMYELTLAKCAGDSINKGDYVRLSFTTLDSKKEIREPGCYVFDSIPNRISYLAVKDAQTLKTHVDAGGMVNVESEIFEEEKLAARLKEIQAEIDAAKAPADPNRDLSEPNPKTPSFLEKFSMFIQRIVRPRTAQVLYPVLRVPLSVKGLIEANNLTLKQMQPQANVISSVHDLVGREASTNLAAGKPILSNQISPRPDEAKVTLVVHRKDGRDLQRGNVLQASDLSWIEGKPPANTIQDPQEIVDKIYWPVTDTSNGTLPPVLKSDTALPVSSFRSPAKANHVRPETAPNESWIVTKAQTLQDLVTRLTALKPSVGHLKLPIPPDTQNLNERLYNDLGVLLENTLKEWTTTVGWMLENQQALLTYSLPSHVDNIRSTRLGNLLMAASDYPERAYSINTTVILPKLLAALSGDANSEPSIKRLVETEANLNLLLLTSFWSAVLTVIGFLSLLLLGGAWWVFMLVSICGPVLWWITKEAACAQALSYGEALKTVIDLKRRELWTKLGIVPDKQTMTHDEERVYWKYLNTLFTNGVTAKDAPSMAFSGGPAAGGSASQPAKQS